MTQEDKQLLLKDICSRLPYHDLWVQYDNKNWLAIGYGHERVELLSSIFSSAAGPCPLIDEIKPYLRPMDSMTEDEREEFRFVGGIMSYNPQKDSWAIAALTPEAYDWLNEHHFDFRGLIEKGLALEAPENMY